MGAIREEKKKRITSNPICPICRDTLLFSGALLPFQWDLGSPRASAPPSLPAHPGTSLSIRRCIANVASLEGHEGLWGEEGLFGATPFLPMESSNRKHTAKPRKQLRPRGFAKVRAGSDLSSNFLGILVCLSHVKFDWFPITLLGKNYHCSLLIFVIV